MVLIFTESIKMYGVDIYREKKDLWSLYLQREKRFMEFIFTESIKMYGVDIYREYKDVWS